MYSFNKYFEGRLNKALVVEQPAIQLDTYLSDNGVDVHRLDYVPNEDQLIEEINKVGAQILFKRSRVGVSRRVIASCPTLYLIQLCCIGDDSVDKQACAEFGVMVFNDPVSNGRSVVELVIGNLISLSRRLYETNIRCRQGLWDKNNHNRFEVYGKNLAILGLGNIGRSVARAATALGMNILFFDTRQVSIELGKELGWKHMTSLVQLFREADCLSVHLSARDIQGLSNEGVLSEDLLMQLGAERENSPRIFINFSRGFIHTTQALKTAIAKGSILRAAVDVYPKEPRKGEKWENPYVDTPQVVVFPHIGASTQEAQPRIARRVSETCEKFSAFGSVRETPYRPRAALALTEQPQKGQALLMVLHSTARGTKRAIGEAIYDAGRSNLASVHTDFNEYGFAYDLALIDAPLSPEVIVDLATRAKELSGEENAIRSVRQVLF